MIISKMLFFILNHYRTTFASLYLFILPNCILLLLLQFVIILWQIVDNLYSLFSF